jgi:hypothetical protein
MLTRGDVLTAEAVSVGAVVLLVENRERVAGALPVDHWPIIALKRDLPPSVSDGVMGWRGPWR